MSAIQTNRNADLARLEADGFRLQIVQKTANHLLISGIPAVTHDRQVVAGTLYCPLELDANGDVKRPLSSHQCWWIGTEPPCDETGRRMDELISNLAEEDKGDGIKTVAAFSRKRENKTPYGDLHEKIWTYIELIWHPARAIDPHCDPRLDKPVKAVVEAQESVFRYPDAATTKAGIGAATAKLTGQKIAIIGLGGTGSYLLDLLAKVPVQEIHIFDGNTFELHNAYRSPGAPAKGDLTDPPKVEWFFSIYDKMHAGIKRHPYYVTAGNVAELQGFNFVFVAIDDADARKVIVDNLIMMKVPFIDVGLDVDFDETGRLRGQIRCTVGSPEANGHIYEVVPLKKHGENDLYRNIQIADLNMANAAMAVMKWKKICGFYGDDLREHHSIYTISVHSLSKEDRH